MNSEWRLNREDFLGTLEQLSPGLSPKEDVEQGSCFAFDGKRILTYNDEIACWHKSPLKITGAVAAKPLLALLHRMTEEEIVVRLKDESLVIKGKRRSAGVIMEGEVTLPIESVERPTSWEPLHEEFCEAIQLVESSAATDVERDGFDKTCVHITPKWIEATNNLQAIRYSIKTGVREAVLVRSSSIRHIVNMGMIEFAETENWIHFRNPQKLVMSCRRFLEDYSSLKEILIPEGHPVKLSTRMADAAEGAHIFTGENADDDQITVKIVPGKMIISGRGPHGWFREHSNIKYAGKPLEFLVVPKMFQEIVKKHRSCLISERRLHVDGGKWRFVACLNPPSDAVSDDSSEGSDDGESEKHEEETEE